VRLALSAGAAGVVVGGIRDGRVDTGLIRRVVDAANGSPVTFHRAFDSLPDPREAVATLADLGVRRILTSAGAAAVADALPALAELVVAADGRIEIMAGGGVQPEQIEKILRTGVPAIHASAKRAVAETAGVTLGTAARAGETYFETTDEGAVARTMAALRR